MAFDREFQRYRSNSSKDLIIGLVVSIILHSVLLIEAKNWLQAFAPEHKRKRSEPIPIEFVEVPPKQTKPPPETKRRAANDAVAGGKAKSERPIATARLSPPVKSRTPNSSPKNSPAPEPAKPALPELTQSTVRLPNRSPQTQQTSPKKTTADSTISKLRLKLRTRADKTTTPEPKPEPQKIALAPTTPKPQPKPQPTVVAPNISKPQPKPQAAVAAPITPKPQTLTRREKKDLLPPKSASEQLATRTTPKTASQAQRSQASGAASRLGGPVMLSSRNLGMPNSNRSNLGAAGIDARRDADIGSYLQQLQQRVRQQWIPGMTQSSKQTVVYFVVSRSGQVRSLSIVRPSGSSVTDKAALGAVARAAPFAPLPTGYSRDYINIRFTFNINVSGELELWAR